MRRSRRRRRSAGGAAAGGEGVYAAGHAEEAASTPQAGGASTTPASQRISPPGSTTTSSGEPSRCHDAPSRSPSSGAASAAPRAAPVPPSPSPYRLPHPQERRVPSAKVNWQPPVSSIHGNCPSLRSWWSLWWLPPQPMQKGPLTKKQLATPNEKQSSVKKEDGCRIMEQQAVEGKAHNSHLTRFLVPGGLILS